MIPGEIYRTSDYDYLPHHSSFIPGPVPFTVNSEVSHRYSKDLVLITVKTGLPVQEHFGNMLVIRHHDYHLHKATTLRSVSEAHNDRVSERPGS